MSFFDTAKNKAATDRHYKQAEGAIMTATAAATVFLVKVAIEHLTSRQPNTPNQRHDSLVDRILRGF